MNRHRIACLACASLLAGHLLTASEVPGLVGATLLVNPSQVVASGLQKVHGTAVVTVTTQRDYLGRVRCMPEDPLVLWRPLPPQDRCGTTGLYRVWPYLCAPSHPNRSVVCQFDGIISNCQPGSGGGGEPPPFAAQIVHVDLDVDSDNDSDPLAGQKRPSRSDDEDAVEFPSEPELPGLVLITNRGFEEGGYGDGSAPVEDRRKDGIDPTDLDLSQGRLEIRGGKAGYAELLYPEQLYRIYRSAGSGWSWWRSGERIRLAPGSYAILLEGIDPGMGTTFVTFIPDDLSSGGQPAIDKQRVTVVDIALQVDRDRNGTVGEEATDLTWTTHPLRFWTNNDREGTDRDASGAVVEIDQEPGSPDYDNDRWTSGRTARLRDLEDCNRMRLVVRGIDEHLRAGRMSVALRWDDDGGGLKLKGYWNEDQDLGMDYLRTAAAGERFCAYARLLAEAVGSDQAEIPVGQRSLVPGSGGYHSPWLWDAIGTAQRGGGSGSLQRGRLGVVVRWGTGRSARPIAWYRHLHLALSDARRWYEHDTCGDFTASRFDQRPHAPRQAGDGDYRYTPGEPSLWVQDADKLRNPDLNNSKIKVMVFIHGYRMQPWERRAFAETMLKRLYWQDFGGRIVLLSWPTEYVSGTLGQLFSPANYDRSEVVARLAGREVALANWLGGVSSRLDVDPEDVTITCHSMGNVVLSSIVRAHAAHGQSGQIAGSYLALQSADVAAAYHQAAGPLTAIEDLPPGLLGGIISDIDGSVMANALAPDLFRYDAPRLARPIPPGGLGVHEEVLDPDTGAGLRSPEDGAAYARGVLDAFTRKINLFNANDYATAASWYVNAAYRAQGPVGEGDTGYGFRRLPQRDQPGWFSDQWLAQRNDSNVPAWINDGPWFPISRRGRLFYQSLPWQMESVDLNRWTERAVILSMITTPRSRALGAHTDGLALAFSAINGRLMYGLTNSDFHHSYQFNYSIQTTREIFAGIRSIILGSAP